MKTDDIHLPVKNSDVNYDIKKLLFLCSVLDIQYPSLSVHAPADGDIILQVRK